MEILKIQRPLGGNHKPLQALIYNESRSITVMFPFEGGLAGMFDEGELKIYVKGYVDEKGILQLFDKVEEKGW